ncbi:MAG: lipoprotein [Candidatus Sericytochromatia bacterium]|nr:lipoprotein [Candidatus Sericytochromatia bacterium]
MKKVLLAASALLALTACSDPIEKVVTDNMAGLQSNDIDLVMSTIDPQSPAYESTRAQTARLLKDYNLEFKIESMSVMSKPLDEKKEMERAAQESQDLTGLNAAIDSFITEEEQAAAEERQRQEAAALSKRPLKAEVKVTQLTRSTDANTKNFFDNRVTVIHTLHKYPTDENPEWKIYSSDIRDVKVIADEG